jgi:hypothetical protein
MKFALGQSIPRLEDDTLLRGAGRYTDDFALARAAHVVFVRSPHAHAKIRRVSIDEAMKGPGVIAVLTGKDAKADGLPTSFDQNFVLTDALLTESLAMSVEDVQAFFEDNPYGTRSWLASYQADGVSAAEMVVEAAVAHEINPVVLIARMQVETSLVSKTTAPTTRLIDRALGCGCPDGGTCNPSYSGLRRQLDCGARTLRRWYDASIAGDGLATARRSR